jgi:amidase
LPVLSVGSFKDPLWVPAPPADGAARVRIGLVRSSPGLFVHPAVAAAVDEAGRRLRAAGFEVEEVSPPPIAETVQLWSKMVFAELREAWPGFSAIADADAVRANQLFLDVTAPISGKEYMAGVGEILAMRRKWAAFLERYPVLIGPNSGELPFEAGFDLKGPDETRHQIAAQALMVTVNLLGLPGVAVPTGKVNVADAPNGLPVGVQVIGKRFGDELALRVANEIQQRGPAVSLWAQA